jgi:D-glycero-D-manno-heptose 1,7-bisphosphate phosphatase
LREKVISANVTDFTGVLMQRAVFLDRDGTVCEEVGYLNHVDRMRLFPWTAAAIRKFNAAGLRTVLVTNQSGVAKGYFPEALVDEVHQRLRQELADSGASLDAIYYCPHHPEGKVPAYRRMCDCRKPSLGMIQRAATEHDLDLTLSFMVGDKYVDLETAYRAGMRAVLVLSGYGKGEYLYQSHTWSRMPDYIAEDLADAADWILSQTPNFAIGDQP